MVKNKCSVLQQFTEFLKKHYIGGLNVPERQNSNSSCKNTLGYISMSPDLENVSIFEKDSQLFSNLVTLLSSSTVF